MKHQPFYNYLEQYLAELKLELDIDNLVKYLTLLTQWNKVHNLTAITEPQAMVCKHILDSLCIAPFMHGTRIIDVGSGAGLPGIPLALLMPQCEFTLLDSNHKKTAFLQHVAQQLHITNVVTVHTRVEQYRPIFTYDTVVTRAFSSLQDMLRLTHHLCSPTGYFVAMKGQLPQQELCKIVDRYPHYRVKSVTVPGLEATRHCIIIAATNQGFTHG